MLALGLIVLVGGMLLGLPLFLSFSMEAIIHAFGYIKIPMTTVPQLMFSAVDSYVLMALIFFMLAGFIMEDAGLSKTLVDMVNTWVCHLPAGLAWVMAVVTAVFGALTASGAAAISAVGLLMIPRMVAVGYPRNFCVAMIASLAQLGIIIPPSAGLILYGFITETSIAALFIAGIVPGVLYMSANGITASILAWRAGRRGEVWGKMPPASWHERGTALVKALPALTFPVIILGGIYGGYFSPTEAALVACFYGAILALAYRRFNLVTWRDECKEALRIKGMLLFLIAPVILFAKLMTYARIPHMVAQAITSMGLSYEGLVFVILLLYIFIGFFAEALVILFVTVPILFPVVTAVGMDPVQFGVVIILINGLASCTPPVGMHIFTASAIFDVPCEELFVKVIPFVIAQAIVVFMIAYIPQISLWLPGLAGLL